MEEGIVRDGLSGGLDIRDLEILGTGSWTLGGQWRAVEQLVEVRRQWHRRTGQAQKERGPGFVGTQ